MNFQPIEDSKTALPFSAWTLTTQQDSLLPPMVARGYMCSDSVCATHYAEGVPASGRDVQLVSIMLKGVPASKVEATSMSVVPFTLRIPTSVIVAPDPLPVWPPPFALSLSRLKLNLQ